jgi:Flp pilus assembly CpaF family ATPase
MPTNTLIYGKTGTGKTTLIKQIKEQILKNGLSERVIKIDECAEIKYCEQSTGSSDE